MSLKTDILFLLLQEIFDRVSESHCLDSIVDLFSCGVKTLMLERTKDYLWARKVHVKSCRMKSNEM